MQSAEEAFLADAQAAADARGVPLADVIAGLEHAVAFDRLLENVVDLYGDIFAGAWTDDFPYSKSSIAVKGPIPPGLGRLVDDADIEVNLVGGAPYSRDEMKVLTYEVQQVLRAEGHVAAAWLSERDGGIFAEVTRTPTTALPGFAADARIRVADAVESKVPGAGSFLESRLEVIVAPAGYEALFFPEHTYGGGIAQDDGVYECTTGFTVNFNSGGTGVVTAGHCHGINQYKPEFSGAYSMPWKSEHQGFYGDFEFHTSTHIEPDDFYANFSVLRDVVSTATEASINQGDPVCVFGRTSGLDCTTEVEVTYRCEPVIGGGPDICHLVVVDEHVTQGKDSGGPWFWNQQAIGVHAGEVVLYSDTASAFSPVWLIPEQHGATIRK